MSNATLTETRVTQTLDERGQLDVARNPGTYALEVDVPDGHDLAAKRWDSVHDARPGEDALARLADAEKVAYVGASGHVYDRLCDHASGDVRQPALLKVFDAVDLVSVWHFEDPFEAEFTTARWLVQDGWTVWTDGRVLG